MARQTINRYISGEDEHSGFLETDIDTLILSLEQKKENILRKHPKATNLHISLDYGDEHFCINFYCNDLETKDEAHNRMVATKNRAFRKFQEKIKEKTEYETYLELRKKYGKEE